MRKVIEKRHDEVLCWAYCLVCEWEDDHCSSAVEARGAAIAHCRDTGHASECSHDHIEGFEAKP
jgi:hypothetical protein